MIELPWEAAVGIFFDGMVGGVAVTLIVLSIAEWIRAKRYARQRTIAGKCDVFMGEEKIGEAKGVNIAWRMWL